MAGVMVLVMTWLVMPVMTRVFKFWLFSANKAG
jgi:antibiotic biosynthesis monooxygenase (ABM) superfamily enzyme